MTGQFVQILIIENRHAIFLSDTVLDWFSSPGSTQRVCIRNRISSRYFVTCGVPQWSVVGQALYSLYCEFLGYICSRHRVSYHFYADDIQIYFTVDVKRISPRKFASIMECIGEEISWMAINLPKLNPDKTEFILFHTWRSSSPVTSPNDILCGRTVSLQVKNLRVFFDSATSMNK